MITVIAIIAILAGLILAINGLVQAKSAKARAEAEIRMLSAAMESYKTDIGGYPQDATKTDKLDPRLNTTADADPHGLQPYSASSRYLYENLTGDTNDTGLASNMTKNYAPDFWKPSRLGGNKVNGVVTVVGYIQDPYGNSYGYSTAGLSVEQTFRAGLGHHSGGDASEPPRLPTPLSICAVPRQAIRAGTPRSGPRIGNVP